MSPTPPLPPPLPQEDRPRPRHAGLVPVLLSSTVWPGTGQLLQKRWHSAIFFLVAFIATVLWFAVAFIHVLSGYYALGMDFSNANVTPPGIGSIVRPFLACVVIWIGSIADTLQAQWYAASPNSPT